MSLYLPVYRADAVGASPPLDLPGGSVSPFTYGAIADGSSHPLSGVYGSLGAAQMVYPFATALSQELDYCACRAAANVALGSPGNEHAYTLARLNKTLYFPPGDYQFGEDTLTLCNVVGGRIVGGGRFTTRITANGSCLRFDGLWYSAVDGMALVSGGSAPALDVDGNVPGHAYDTRGVQGNTFSNLYIDGGNGLYAFAMCRQGQSGGQGSENVFINVHLVRGSEACYYQYGYNALANQFIGGNIQDYTKHGIKLVAGSLSVYGTGFQSTHGYTQIMNDGWDISAQDAGSFDLIIVQGVRTESLRLYKGGGSQIADIQACQQNPALPPWYATTARALDYAVLVVVGESKRLFVVRTAGITGATEPSWPTNGSTVTDGSVVWQEEAFDVINIYSGEVRNCSILAGSVVKP